MTDGPMMSRAQLALARQELRRVERWIVQWIVQWRSERKKNEGVTP